MTRKLNPNKCQKVIYDAGQRQCRRPPTRDGYCGIHHPDAVKARGQKSHLRMMAKENDRTRPWQLLDEAKARIKELEVENAELKVHLARLKSHWS